MGQGQDRVEKAAREPMDLSDAMKAAREVMPALGAMAGARKTMPALDQMLAAREARWARRMELAEISMSLISMTLCVPLPFRTSPEGKALLAESAAQLEEDLRKEGLRRECSGADEADAEHGRKAYPEGLPEGTEYLDGADGIECLDGADGLVVFLPCEGEAEAVKRFCVQQEETLPLGRLLDMDVTAQDGTPVGRADLGLPPRKCFLCGRPAAECVAAARHKPEEIAAYVEAQFRKMSQQLVGTV